MRARVCMHACMYVYVRACVCVFLQLSADVQALEYRDHKARLLNKWLHVGSTPDGQPPARERNEEEGMCVKRRRLTAVGEIASLGVKVHLSSCLEACMFVSVFATFRGGCPQVWVISSPFASSR